MAIVELRGENVKRLTAVRIPTNGKRTMVIGGQNGAGKSSVLDCILFALGGRRALPDMPIRKGADYAEAEVVIDGEIKLRVTHRIKPDGKSTLTVKQIIGDVETKIGSPQTVLNSLLGETAFDPLAFTRMKSSDQVETLRKLVGVDLSDLEDQESRLAEQRKEAGRKVRDLEAELKACPYHDDAPEEPVDVSALMAELEEADKGNRYVDDLQRNAKDARFRVETCMGRVERAEAEVERLTRLLAEAKENLQHESEELNAARVEESEARRTAEAAVKIGVTPIRERIAGAEEVNQKVRDNAQRVAKAKQLDAAKKVLAEFEDAISETREAAQKRLSDATWPVDGLGFGNGCVTFNDIPFEQCSSAEQLRLGTEIGLAQNPKLPVLLIRDGSLLDDASLKLIDEIAERRNAQIWIERVGKGDECSVIIEDGEVVDARGGDVEAETAVTA